MKGTVSNGEEIKSAQIMDTYEIEFTQELDLFTLTYLNGFLWVWAKNYASNMFHTRRSEWTVSIINVSVCLSRVEMRETTFTFLLVRWEGAGIKLSNSMGDQVEPCDWIWKWFTDRVQYRELVNAPYAWDWSNKLILLAGWSLKNHLVIFTCQIQTGCQLSQEQKWKNVYALRIW